MFNVLYPVFIIIHDYVQKYILYLWIKYLLYFHKVTIEKYH